MSNENESTGDGDREQVLRISRALLQAVNQSDATGVRAVWAIDGILMPPHHPEVNGRDAITTYFTDLFRRGRFEFEFTASEIEVDANVAFEHVQYRATMFPAGGGTPTCDQGKGLHVFRRRPAGGWQLHLDIWNSDSPRP